MQNLQLVTRCEQRSTDSSSSKLESLISQWIVRFAVNAGVPLDASAQANYRVLWLEGFSDLSPERMQAALIACMRSHPFPKMPTVADVRQHLQKAESSATEEAAGQKWQRVLDYAVRLSPDYPDKNPPHISEQVRRAINAAGGLAHIRDCGRDDLPWARKRFIEAYLRYAELDERDGNLLPEGMLKNLITGGAQKQLLAPDAYETARTIGLAYAENLDKPASPEERLRVADELAEAARKVIEAHKSQQCIVTVSDAGREALRKQAQRVRDLYPGSKTTDPALLQFISKRPEATKEVRA